VRELADEKGLTIPQVALAWVMNQPLNIFALVGCATGEEFKVNVAALDLKLSPAECAWLDLQTNGR
ncbi:MAG TPA: aldo/keto reductase, partial [Planctomycetota bacterium]|nr:aldo/keto reductase [Planctomycetota bacterium]